MKKLILKNSENKTWFEASDEPNFKIVSFYNIEVNDPSLYDYIKISYEEIDSLISWLSWLQQEISQRDMVV